MTLGAAFQAGSPEAMNDVYRRYGRVVYAVAYHVLGTRDLAEEAVQETFLRAWRAAASFDSSKDFGPWLATIARRVSIDLHRRDRRNRHVALDAATDGEPALVDLPPGIEHVYEVWETRQAIDELPRDERQLVELQHRYGLTHLQISQRLQIPVGTVKSRSFRAHKRLAARLVHLQAEARTETPAPA